MPSQLVIVTAIAILQWLCVTASVGIAQWLDPNAIVPVWFDPTAILAGNLQIIIVIWVYQTITKYIKF